MVMADYKEVSFKDITVELSDGLHAAPKFYPNGDYIFVNAKNIVNGRILDVDPDKKTSYSEYLKYKIDLDENTVLYSIDGTIGNVAKYRGEKVVLGKGACYLKLKPEVDTNYIFFYLQSPQFKAYIRKMSTGSTIRHISLKTMRNHKFNLPDLLIQKKIANILSRIQNKIDTNQQINENLLQQARTIFRKWVSGAADVKYCLSEIADINTDTYSPKDNWDFVNYLDTSSITAGTINEVQHILPMEEKLPSRARRILKKGDIVFSTVRPNQLHYGIISNPLPNMLGSTGFAVIHNKIETIPNEIIYLALIEPSFIEQMQQLAEQSVSTFPSIRPADLDACVIPEPSIEDSNLIASIKAFFNCMATNSIENKRLADLRDTLLPRLMSGELDVSDLDL